MHRQNIFVGVHSQGAANRYGFLANTRKPFANAALPQQDQHLLFNHARKQQFFIKCQQSIIIEVFPVKNHNVKLLKFLKLCMFGDTIQKL